MMLLLFLALGLLLVGTVLLVVGADWFLDGASDLARALGVSALVLGVLLAGLEPEEMLTAAIASARGEPTLAVGNVIGTNVTIITAALGLSALIFPMVIDKSVRRQALIATLVSVLPIVLLFLGIVTQLAGVLLLVVFVGYTLFLFRTDQEAVKRMAASEEDDEDDDDSEKAWHTRPRLYWKPVLLTFGGLAAMAGGGPAIVEGALRLAQIMGIGQGAVGATIVSLGTGAEMIALGVSAARKQRSDILVGGILGSFVYNLLVTLQKKKPHSSSRACSPATSRRMTRPRLNSNKPARWNSSRTLVTDSRKAPIISPSSWWVISTASPTCP
jgi:cation:H+ antiporter